MVANTLLPDLGLDPPKLPNLADPDTRSRLSPSAIQAFFKIVEFWGLKNNDSRALFGGISNGRYYEMKKSPKGELTQDEITRVSLLIGIYKALNILFDQELANQWVSRPNSNPIFNNASPLDLMIRVGQPAFMEVRRLLDSRRGGN